MEGAGCVWERGRTNQLLVGAECVLGVADYTAQAFVCHTDHKIGYFRKVPEFACSNALQ